MCNTVRSVFDTDWSEKKNILILINNFEFPFQKVFKKTALRMAMSWNSLESIFSLRLSFFFFRTQLLWSHMLHLTSMFLLVFKFYSYSVIASMSVLRAHRESYKIQCSSVTRSRVEILSPQMDRGEIKCAVFIVFSKHGHSALRKTL